MTIAQRQTLVEPSPPSRRMLDQEAVDEADQESFPASDPPSWTSTHAGAPVRAHDASVPPNTHDTD